MTVTGLCPGDSDRTVSQCRPLTVPGQAALVERRAARPVSRAADGGRASPLGGAASRPVQNLSSVVCLTALSGGRQCDSG